MDLHHRAQAVAAVLAKYDGKPFEWGRFDCVRLAANAVKALGHPVSLARGGSYRSELGAVRALKRAGYVSPVEALDGLFKRIPPASALPGDIIAFESGHEWPALMVAVGNGRVFGFMPGADGAGVCGIIAPVQMFVAAWRVPVLIVSGNS